MGCARESEPEAVDSPHARFHVRCDSPAPSRHEATRQGVSRVARTRTRSLSALSRTPRRLGGGDTSRFGGRKVLVGVWVISAAMAPRGRPRATSCPSCTLALTRGASGVPPTVTSAPRLPRAMGAAPGVSGWSVSKVSRERSRAVAVKCIRAPGSMVPAISTVPAPLRAAKRSRRTEAPRTPSRRRSQSYESAAVTSRKRSP